MKSNLFLATLLFCWSALSAQQHAFESVVPTTFQASAGGTLSITDQRCKDGKNSLLWEFSGSSVLRVNEPTVFAPANNNFNNRGGVSFWIYNDKSRSEPLTIRFVDTKTGELCYYFHFNLEFTGWKACWMAFHNMRNPDGGDAIRKTNVDLVMELETPNDSEPSRLFIDRYYVLNQVDHQTMPDAQIPDNNAVYRKQTNAQIYHWGALWLWELLDWDTPLPTSVTQDELDGLKTINDRLAASHNGLTATWTTLKRSIDNYGIGREGVSVRPLVTKYDFSYNAANDLDLLWLSTTLYQLATLNRSGNAEAGAYYMKVMEWAMDQGFAFGSCMGTNHHYGYDTRNIFLSAHMMREYFVEQGVLRQMADLMSHWSGLPECRQPYNYERTGLTDGWNTLMIGRLVGALLQPTAEEQVRATRSFYRWMSGSCSIVPGSEGGIKADFTGFHHGGHYPAYSVPGYAAVGEIIRLGLDTEFGFEPEGRETFKKALLAVSNYSNGVDWGIGICGRHPLNPVNKISASAQQAFGNLAKTYSPVDRELAAAFLRINTAVNSPLAKEFVELGISAEVPSGFYPYNYSCFGVFRKDNWMLSMKGYNRFVWGSEIYTNDNRYGRYQSYGSAQIIVGSEAESRWEQNGWDWNRLPGTTSIHLPFDRLESPVNGTLMVKSPQTFSGAIDLMGKYGMFATRIQEENRDRFTPSFVARKSIFCVDNRAVFLGTGIANQQVGGLTYPTETTLFQQKLNSNEEAFSWKGSDVTAFPFDNAVGEVTTQVEYLTDLNGNYYRIEAGQKVALLKRDQDSRNDKSRAVTNGKFATAYLNHGANPQGASYEYMIHIQPTEADKAQMGEKPYRVWKQDNTAHIVEDIKNGVVGYAIFENYQDMESEGYLLSADKEILVMLQPQESGKLALSMCDPDINLADASYAVAAPSLEKVKSVQLRGVWSLEGEHTGVSITTGANRTTVTATCTHGSIYNLMLSDIANSANKPTSGNFTHTVVNGIFTLSGPEAHVAIWNSNGICLTQGGKSEGDFTCTLPQGVFIVSVSTSTGRSVIKVVN